jgi:hypothetical protein
MHIKMGSVKKRGPQGWRRPAPRGTPKIKEISQQKRARVARRALAKKSFTPVNITHFYVHRLDLAQVQLKNIYF